MGFIELFLEPLTPLIFGRTRTSATSGITYSYYPAPLPSTVAGMVRSLILDSLILNKECNSVPECFSKHEKLLGFLGKYGGMGWLLIGPYLARRDQGNIVYVYYPKPMDLEIKIDDKCVDPCSSKENLMLEPLKEDVPLSDLKVLMQNFIDSHRYKLNDNFLPIPIRRSEGSKHTYVISAKLMKHYLDLGSSMQAMSVSPEDVVNVECIVKAKEEVGVALDDQKQVQVGESAKGMLYRVEKLYYNKHAGWGIYVALYSENDDVLKKLSDTLKDKIARLGGDGGLVKIHLIEKSDLLEKMGNGSNKYTRWSGQARLVLTSYTVFDEEYVIPNKNLYDECLGLNMDDIIVGWNIASGLSRGTIIGAKPGSIFIVTPKSNISHISVFDRNYVSPEYRNMFGSALLGKV